jgi:primosomal protein N' (replication factor Y)
MKQQEPSPASRARYVKVALPLPVSKLFTYEVPDELSETLLPGRRIIVPFGNRIMSGIAVELASTSDVPDIKHVRAAADTFLSPDLMRLTEWIASYYGCTFGEAAQSVLPPSMQQSKSVKRLRYCVSLSSELPFAEQEQLLARAPKQLALLRALSAAGGNVPMESIVKEWGYSMAVLRGLEERSLVSAALPRDSSPLDSLEKEVLRLTGEQQTALTAMKRAVQKRAFAVFLLHGVTGSGKTEIYLRLANDVLAAGGGCIVLVPEISLLPQAIARYRKVFGDALAVIHSRLTGPERHGIWQSVERGDARIVLGPRSALFSPVRNLRLIIVDEEQDESYKQDEKPRYNARNTALMRGKFEKCIIVLGSATPSAESFHLANQNKYETCTLSRRIGDISLPRIRIIDMRAEESESGIFSHSLLEKLEECVGSGYQSILFLNKRGHARFIQCRACGWVPRCTNCDISLTYHRVGAVLRCHFCGFTRRAVTHCPECASPNLLFSGFGTQRIELDLKGLFPGLRILRMDADTTRGRDGHRKVLEQFSTGRFHVLLGTQMITKGHHFPGVHFVGVLSAEEELNFPDFRSAERTFHQLVQVSGRAGRENRRGEVLVQTFIPDHNVFKYLLANDYNGFMADELSVRKKLSYPPFTRLISALCTGKDPAVLGAVMAEWTNRLRAEFRTSGIVILGPAPPLIPRLKGRYREQILLKGGLSGDEKMRALQLFEHVSVGMKGGRSVDLKWDVDPSSFY